MRNLWFTGVAFAAGLSAASWFVATPQSHAAEAMVDRLTVASLTGILKEWGATDVAEGASETLKPSDTVTLTIRNVTFKHNGLTYLGTLFCNDATAGCVGLRVTCAFDGTPPLAKVNSFNTGYRSGKAYEEEQLLISERYMIIDHGVARANIITQLDVFEYATNTLLQHINSGDVTASAPIGNAVPDVLKVAAALDGSVHKVSAADMKGLPVNHVAK
jgi:hypothetical protein